MKGKEVLMDLFIVRDGKYRRNIRRYVEIELGDRKFA